MNLILTGIEKKFGSKNVLTGAGYSFEKGKIYGLLGRNGAGKTTLFNCISGEIPFEKGKIQLIEDGKDVMDFSRIGFSFTNPVLPEFLTGYEFLKFFIDINRDKIQDLQPVSVYFDLIQMEEEDRYRLIKGYSHGMKNKIQLLCLLVLRPPVLLLDEPLTSFDVVVAHEMKELFKRIKKDHIIIFSTHILQLAEDLCDEIVILNQGVLEGVAEKTFRSPDFEEKLMEMFKEEKDV